MKLLSDHRSQRAGNEAESRWVKLCQTDGLLIFQIPNLPPTHLSRHSSGLLLQLFVKAKRQAPLMPFLASTHAGVIADDVCLRSHPVEVLSPSFGAPWAAGGSTNVPSQVVASLRTEQGR